MRGSLECFVYENHAKEVDLHTIEKVLTIWN